MTVNSPDMGRAGVWAELFPAALSLMAHLESQVSKPHWTFGGGTVLMLRIGHRQSKDIDLFVPDPQYLGFVNPRLSEVAEETSTDYEEASEYLKFYLPSGEIALPFSSTAVCCRPHEFLVDRLLVTNERDWTWLLRL